MQREKKDIPEVCRHSGLCFFPEFLFFLSLIIKKKNRRNICDVFHEQFSTGKSREQQGGRGMESWRVTE